MDTDLYDEFGNYVGPELGSDEEEVLLIQLVNLILLHDIFAKFQVPDEDEEAEARGIDDSGDPDRARPDEVTPMNDQIFIYFLQQCST